LISESEKERILGLHKKLIKESLLNEGYELFSFKGQQIEKTYTSDPKNYPPCIRQMGKPISVTSANPQCSFAIQGTGSLAGFYFFPIPYYSNTANGNLTQQNDNPKVYNPKTKSYEVYACDAMKRVLIGNNNVAYNLTPARKIPKTEEDLTKSGYYLTIGDRGELVKKIQKLLANNAEGYATMFSQQTKPGKTPFDGIFGKTTQGVVKEYQKDNQITQTGKVDNSTWEKLKNTRIRRDWDINTGGWVFVDTSEPLSTVAKRDITQIPTADKTIAPLTN